MPKLWDLLLAMEERYNKMKLEVQALTKQGHEFLSNGSANEATATFLEAYQLAKQTDEEYTLRGCRFNLGACYVASGNPKVGLKYLEQAIPPEDTDDGQENFADLWYNIGIARHALSDIDGAIRAYKKAYTAYKEMTTNNRLEAECLSKLAVCYHLKQKLKDSHDTYTRAQELYKQLNDKNNEALCLVSNTGVLSQMGNIDECAKTLDVLLDVCQEVDDKHLQAKIYHDIGLLYINEKLYESASECLEQALSCIEQSDQKEKHLYATILQNIGAVCNYMKLYEKGISFHQTSADMYGEIGDRKTQTQVFNNLAYAYTQMEKYTDAITSFQHAIQAGKDCGDRESQSLATEGIAAIWFRLKRFKKAVLYYKEALHTLTLSSEPPDSTHTDRIVDKLVDAIQYQLNEEGKLIGRASARKMATDPHRGRRRFSDSFDMRRPLVAHGLEPDMIQGLSEEDSDESLREEDLEEEDEEEESVDGLELPDGIKPINKHNSEKSKVTIDMNPHIYKPEDLANNMESSTLRSNYYEQPVPKLPQAVKQNAENQNELSPVKRSNSKMCLVM